MLQRLAAETGKVHLLTVARSQDAISVGQRIDWSLN